MAIGGHYDHLGMGGPGTGSRVPDTVAVHYGADDNASGTAGVIELAGYFSAKKDELSRSMIFVAFAAEEMGLLGSKYFVENPPVDLEKIDVMFNLDMIGRLNEEQRVSIGGTGTALEFDSLLGLVEHEGLDLSFSPEGSGPSDHASFYAKDISVLFISTGAHPDYHTPGDSVGSLNIEGMNVLTNYVAKLIEVIGSEETLSFQEAGPKRTVSSRQNLKVTLGFMPDFTDNSNTGMKVDFPTPGKPAAVAGIKKGDRIVGINGLKVANIQDYMVRLKSLEPGQIVTVELLRGEEKIVLLVQL
jgi:Zn-dependent M28 family amino/carboxypeptidase